MPCNTSDGMGDAYREDPKARRQVETLEVRVAELEAAFCGLLTLLKAQHVELPPDTPPALRAWWEKHQLHPGHEPS